MWSAMQRLPRLLNQMDDVGHAQRVARGYVAGSREEATPSVANLNGLTTQFAIAQFLAIVTGLNSATGITYTSIS